MKGFHKFTAAFGIAALVGCGYAFADETETREITHLSIIGNDGEVKQFEIDKIDRITFDEDNGLLLVDDAPVAIDDIQSIRFDLEVIVPDPDEDDTSGIETTLGELKFTLFGSMATITPAPGDNLDVNVFDLSGIRVYSAKSAGQQTIDFSNFSHGTYIIKANNKVIKIQK